MERVGPIKCIYCNYVTQFESEFIEHIKSHPNVRVVDGPGEAKRITRNIRYDILDPTFLEYLAKIADYGAKKYGDFNWQQSHLTGDKDAINHIYKHLKSYRLEEQYDHPELGEGKEWHLAAIAFNAMMEFFWAIKEKNDR